MPMQREGHAFFHLPGPDLGDDELGALFNGITCREQVFWMTTPGSGWFLPGLSAKGRIVITATTHDQEFNETEFPTALADASRPALAELDADKDGKVSVWELFVRTGENVVARFEADMRRRPSTRGSTTTATSKAANGPSLLRAMRQRKSRRSQAQGYRQRESRRSQAQGW